MKRAIIVHGWQSSPDANWFSSVAEDLKRIGYQVNIPEMPNTEFPKKEEWVRHLYSVISQPDEDLVIIGHSLGCIAILRYIESLPVDTKIGKIVLVAGFAESLGYKEIKSFTENEIDFGKVRNTGGKFFVFHAKNDPVVAFEFGEKLARYLHAEFFPQEIGEHLNLGTGYFSFPEIAEVIKN